MHIEKLQHFNFELDDVIRYGKNIPDKESRKKYFKDVLFLRKNNKVLIDHSLYAPYNFEKEIKREIKYLDNENGKKKKTELKEFGRGELKKKLEKIAKDLGLIKWESVPSKKVQLITRMLRKEGYNAKADSVWGTLRDLDYVQEKLK